MSHHNSFIGSAFIDLEILERRQLFAIVATIDYSFDTNGFFDDPDRRALMQLAATTVVSRIEDNLASLIHSPENSWSASFKHPATGDLQTVQNRIIQQDEIVIYVGGRDLAGERLAVGEIGGWQATGDDDWIEAVGSRGQENALTDEATDFARWGGAISFDTEVNWHFAEKTKDLGNDEFDFLSAAMHYVAHVLGFGRSDSWNNNVNGENFIGENTLQLTGNALGMPLSASRSHWRSGTTFKGVEAAMDPSLAPGERKILTELDYAGLADVGWEIAAPLPQPEISITVDDPIAREGSSLDTAVFVVRRSDGDSLTDLRVRFRISGSADNGEDYRSILASTIIRGGASKRTITIRALNDSLEEGTERVRLTLRPDLDYRIDSASDTARVSIRDNDVSPSLANPIEGKLFSSIVVADTSDDEEDLMSLVH